MGCCGEKLFNKESNEFFIELLTLATKNSNVKNNENNQNSNFKIKEINTKKCKKEIGKNIIDYIKDSKILDNEITAKNFNLNINNSIFYFYLYDAPIIKNYLQIQDIEPFNFELLWKISILLTKEYDKLLLPKIYLINETKFCQMLIDIELNFSSFLTITRNKMNPNITNDDLNLSKQLLTKKLSNSEDEEEDEDEDGDGDELFLNIKLNGEENEICSEFNDEKKNTKLKNYIHIEGNITLDILRNIGEKLSLNDCLLDDHSEDENVENIASKKQSQRENIILNEDILRNNNNNKLNFQGRNNIKQKSWEVSEGFHSSRDSNNSEENKEKIKIIAVYMRDIKITDINIFNDLINLLTTYPFLKKFALIESKIEKDSEIWKAVTKLFNENQNIRWIDLHKSSLNNNNLNSLCKSLEYKRIRYLDISENFINYEGAKFLSEFLSKNSTLQRLILNNNDLEDFKNLGVSYICNSLFNQQNIQFLNFSEMSITCCGLKISELILNTKSLKILLLRDCNLNLKDFQFICGALTQESVTQTLENVDLSCNEMASDKSLEEIAKVIKKNKSITYLNMEKMNLDMKNYNIILEPIKENNKIVCFNFSFNPKLDPKIILEFFYERKELNMLAYIPYKEAMNKNDKKVEFNLDEKKIIEKFKKERKNVKLIYK